MKIRIDSKVGLEIEKNAARNHRSMFFVFGDETNKKIPTLLHLTRRNVNCKKVMKLLWFQQKENNFSRKLEKKWQKKIKRSSKKEDFEREDPFEMLIVSSDITYCGPGNCHKVLGQTYDACIFEDFKSLSPNILARCIETVKGSGTIIFLLESFATFDQLFHLEMDIHAKYKTDWYPDVNPRFNKRFVMSLKSCPSAFSVSNDFGICSLSDVLPANVATSHENAENVSKIVKRLSQFEEAKPYSKLLEQCATVDQVSVVLEIVRLLRSSSNNQNNKSVVSLTSGRGRGKSASLGLSLAAVISSGLSHVCVTSPSVENVQTLLYFACVGLGTLGYKENVDYFIGRSSTEMDGFIVKIEIIKHQRQIIEYRAPRDVDILVRSDFLCIDEAAAIPLNVTKKLLQASTCIISSTIQGYEGTGRSLSLKLLEDVRKKSKLKTPLDLNNISKAVDEVYKSLTKQAFSADATMTELTLSHCIRYSDSDPVEFWLNNLFCLSTTESIPTTSTPALDECRLFQVDLEALFSGSQTSEEVLSDIISIYVASHYKNSPNDLLMLADAPAHKLFCLVSDCSPTQVICVIQVAMEGNVKEESLKKFWEFGDRPSGDLMGWIIDQQFPDHKLALRRGMRVVRIATHSSFQKMGYGKRAMELLIKHCENNTSTQNQNAIQSKVIFKTLEKAEALGNIDHIGASFGASYSLIRFWKSLKMHPVYISQVSNEVTGEHSCIFLKDLRSKESKGMRVEDMFTDFRQRFIRLLPHSFRSWDSNSALEILTSNLGQGSEKNGAELSALDKERLRSYLADKLEMRAVFDILHEMFTQFFVFGNFSNTGHDKMVIMLGVGVQGKSFDEIAFELNEVKHHKTKGKHSDFNANSVAVLLNQAFKSILAKKVGETPGKKFVDKERASKKRKVAEE